MTDPVTLEPAALEFLALPHFARLSTNGRDGYPHTVPIWYAVETGGDGSQTIWFISDRGSAKVRNATADPRAAVTIGGEKDDAFGLLFRGRLTIEDDPQQVMTHRMIDRYEPGDRNAELRALWQDDDIVVLRLHIERMTNVFS